MQFGMHICLSVEQTRINPFTCNSAKPPCGQALHLKCTISYPCLLSMQHFWDIKPGGNTRRMAPATPYIVPCCSFSVFVLVSLFPLRFSSLLRILWWTAKCESSPGRVRLQLCLFMESLLCIGRSINMLAELPDQVWGGKWDKLRCFV